MESDWIYLDTYLLQQDRRIRLPKAILTNLPAEQGKTKFKIFLDKKNAELRLQLCSVDAEACGK